MMGTVFYYSPNKYKLKQAISDKIFKKPNTTPIEIKMEFEIFSVTEIIFFIELFGIQSSLNTYAQNRNAD